MSEGRPSPSAFFYGSAPDVLSGREHLPPTSGGDQRPLRSGRPPAGSSSPMGLSSRLRDLVRGGKCSCLPEIRVQRNVKCFRHTQSLPLERSLLKKKQPGPGLGPSAGRQGYGNSPVSWQNFQDENRKIEQAREAHCLLDKPVS